MFATIEGGIRPNGRVRVSGAKNSATRLLAAALLSNEHVELSNFPTKLVDAQKKIEFAGKLGVFIDVDHENEILKIDSTKMHSRALNREDYDVPIRTTYLLAACQIVRFGIARIPYPGGCPIGGGAGGGRGYDLHIMVWRDLGCTVVERADHIEISGSRFKGGTVSFPISTVGGTENALLCASVADGPTQIFNAYITPEIYDLIEFLKRMGAAIEVSGNSHIIVEGKSGALFGARMNVMPDRIEALTWIVYGILSQGNITIDQVPFASMNVPLIHLEQAGIDFLRNSQSIHVSPECLISGQVQPFEVACGAHPGIISDMQAFYVLLGLLGAGTSRVFDYRYPERISYVAELAKLIEGNKLHAEVGKIVINGPVKFIPGTASSTDLRGSMAVVIAALCAEGISKIDGIEMALRGYNNLDNKLMKLGAKMTLSSEIELNENNIS